MGTHFDYHCPSCGYRAEITGEGDAGELVCTTTILCHDCRRLFDVPDAHRQLGGPWQKVEPACPRGRSHRIEPWVHPGPCPRCGEAMAQGGATLLWD